MSADLAALVEEYYALADEHAEAAIRLRARTVERCQVVRAIYAHVGSIRGTAALLDLSASRVHQLLRAVP